VSRNNDADGWWALGVLLEDLAPGDPDLRIDLVSGTVVPQPASRPLDDLGAACADYLLWSLDRHGVSPAKVVSATLDLRFDRHLLLESSMHAGRDRPFTCVVTIVDDHGREYRAVATGQCTTRDDYGRDALYRSSTRGPLRIRERPPNWSS
jgi:hypothetical protein